MRFIFLLSICLIIFIIFYLSWLPDPHIGKVWFIPNFLRKWVDANENENLRTAIPFILLGIISSIYLTILKAGLKLWITIFITSLLIVIIAETGQLFLPNRVFDLRDMGWGCVGTVLGMAVGAATGFLFNLAKKSIV